MTVDAVLALHRAQRGGCAVCGVALLLDWAGGDRDQVTVDRVDNARAHVAGNCRLACLGCNRARA